MVYQKKSCGNMRSRGFTLIELLVVISMMGILASIIIANYAAQRNVRSLNIAQNELVTNIRKTQSYALASRNVNGSQAVQYYVLKFDTASSSQYSIQAMYNVTNSPVLQRIETINLPAGVTISALSLNNRAPSCLLVAFKMPFGRIIDNDGCVSNNFGLNDDYDKILQFITNNGSASTQVDASTIITIRSKDLSLSPKTVTINGITGGITFQ